MSLTFDTYVPRRSWLHSLDPRVKVWGTAIAATTAFFLPSPALQALFLLGVHALLIGAGIPLRRIAAMWRRMALLVTLILLLQPLFTPGGDLLLALGPLRLTSGGLNRGALLALRVLNLSFVVGGLLFTTEQRHLVAALVRLGMPYTWGLTVSLTLRFIPTLFNLFAAVREAQAARGWEAEGNFLRRVRDHLPVLIAVVIGTLRISDRLTLALAARGLSAAPRSTWIELRMRPHDWIAVALITGGAVAALVALV